MSTKTEPTRREIVVELLERHREPLEKARELPDLYKHHIRKLELLVDLLEEELALIDANLPPPSN